MSQSGLQERGGCELIENREFKRSGTVCHQVWKGEKP